MAGVIVAVIIRDTETGDERRYDLATVPQEPLPPEPPEPPQEPQEPDPPPPPGEFTRLEVNAAFQASELPARAKAWHDALWDATRPGTTYPNPYHYPDDDYSVGRTIGNYFAALLAAFRTTRAPWLLDEMLRVMDAAKGGLKSEGGYQFWHQHPPVWRDSKKPRAPEKPREVDSTLTMGLVTTAARVFHDNADVDPRCAEAAAFWLQFALQLLEYWEMRLPKTGLEKKLTHCWVSMTHAYYNLWRLTGNAEYRAKADGMMQQFVANLETRDARYVWEQGIAGYHATGADQWAKADYIAHTLRDLAELDADGLLPASIHRQRLANTVREMMGTDYITEYITGEGRLDMGKFLNANMVAASQFDASGDIARWAEIWWGQVEVGNPLRRVFAPAYLLALEMGR